MAYADLATKKTMARLSASLNESAADASHMKQSSFARKQLEKMGWSEGTGLGKKRDGMVTHIRTKKREESVGLGGEKKIVEEQSDMWWMDNVGSTLARLQQAKKRKSMSSDNGSDDDSKDRKKAKKKSEKSKSKSDKKEKKRSKKKKFKDSESGEVVKTYTDHELFVATGGARFGMRAQRRAEGKWARTESGSKLWEEEKEARKKIEWNGLGSAKLLLESAAGEKGNKSGSDDNDGDGSSSSGSAKDEPVIIEEISHKTTSKKKKKAKASKKLKKVDDDENEDKKRRKKEKKKAKRAKSS